MLATWFGSTNSAAGVSVTAESALQIMAVQACVRILAESIASLPLVLYQRTADDGKVRAVNRPLYGLLHDRPNRWQTSMEYREMLQGHLCLRGNAYALKVSTNAGLSELVPLHPDRTEPFVPPQGGIAYRHTDDNGQQHVYVQDEIHHIRGLSLDGLKGLDPIAYARESFGLTSAAEEFGARFFKNGSTPSGAFSHPNKISESAHKHLQASVAERYSGLRNAHVPMILEEGMSWLSLGVEPDKAQFLETRKFQLEEVARLFRIPLHMLQHTEKSTSWGTGIEQFNIGFVTHTLRPWFVRWEQAIARDLISNDRRYFVEFLAEGMLRGNTKDRYDAYAVARQWGWLSVNDIRRLENLSQIPGGDEYLTPLNMSPAGTTKDDSADEDEPDEPDEQPRMAPFVRSAAERIVSCQQRALQRAIEQSNGDASELETRAVDFVCKHGEFLRRHLGPLWESRGLTEDDLNRASNLMAMGLTRSINAALAHGIDTVADTVASLNASQVAGEIEQLLETPHGH